ncbi:MAG: hypothetical protein NC421_00010 [Lachnospiraceae bacterium]|nr:hypothetical protein [Lachnospiraceae bacterium]
MALFSERYGYVKVSDVIIRERITPEIQNAICSCYDRLDNIMREQTYDSDSYIQLEKYLWVFFLNKREKEFYTYNGYHIVATHFIESEEEWYKKLDIIEATIKYLYAYERNPMHHPIVDEFTRQLNFEFERHKFAYRVIQKEVVEITSENEIAAIETALQTTSNNIRLHLNKALELYSLRPTGDYRNAIKESISAVEAYCREKTNEETLGKALNKMEAQGITIPKMLKVAFEKLYAYTNQPDTGIRHALMDDDGKYTPSSEEALFMIVSCSSFLNYLKAKE